MGGEERGTDEGFQLIANPRGSCRVCLRGRSKIGLGFCGLLIRLHFIRNEIEDGTTKKK